MTPSRSLVSDPRGPSIRRALLIAGLTFAALTACVGPGPVRREVTYEPPRLPDTQVPFYPAAGQSAQQQARDRYECYQWAVKQTDFDPSQLSLAPHQRVDVVPAAPAGHDTAAGAITGAVIGAMAANPRNAGGGAVLGAITGAALGAASDSEREARSNGLQRRYDAREAQRQGALEAEASRYRRAMMACAEGRGYTVSGSNEDSQN